MAKKLNTHELLNEYRWLPNYSEVAKFAANLAKEGENAQAIIKAVNAKFGEAARVQTFRDKPGPIQVFGEVGKHIPENAYEQLENAMRIPPARRGAIMPDGHKGYGVPIGAVVELENAISPGYIGYDISCMLMLTVLDISPEDFMVHREALANDLRAETAFGVGAEFTQPRQHAVMDAPAWEDTKILKTLKGKAASQLGSSGGGNHFADLVIGEVTENADWLPLAVGKKFVALMTHSGSRGTGHKLATHYVKFAENSAKSTTRRLPKGHGWLTMDSDLGQEYWHAMTLMGEYSVANHELIHQHFCERAGIGQKVQYWNRHNYAWLEGDGVIHRKGATPAETGRVGIIPGTSGTASYLVTGLGNADSLNSSSHGAGRPYSRTEAKRQHNNDGFLKHMKERDILFYGIETDETYQAYKDIETVMDVQDGVLVSRVAKLEPKVVIMGGKADDGD